MTNAEKILELLESLRGPACDDCVSTRAGVEPRQQVHQIGRRLAGNGTLRREKTVCVLCGSAKVTSSLLGPAVDRSEERQPPKFDRHVSPEAARNQLDRFCKGLLEKRQGRRATDGLAALISTLSDSGALPIHQANMMHIIRSLRNAFVHEHLILGKREQAILEHAWSIIEEWA